MREAGQIDNEMDARLFRDFLFNRGIEAEVEENTLRQWSIWVLDDDKIAEAEQWLIAFKQNPAAAEFTHGADGADEKRAQQQKEEEDFRKKMRSRDQVFSNFNIFNAGGVTLILIGISVLVTMFGSFGSNQAVVQKLTIAESFEVPGGMAYFKNLKEVRSGEVWRLITPIFLHFGLIHIIFNMMWLRDLGGMMEQIKGPRFLLLFVLITGVISNLAQYVYSGPGFGGMSGVVYGLLGYVWMQSRFQPWSGFVLHPTTVQMMMIWFVLCLTGLIGNIANAAHSGGLVVGMAWGYIAAHRRDTDSV